MHVILYLLKRFWDVCALRKGPADMPAYKSLLIIVYLIWVLLALVTDLLVDPATFEPRMLWLEILYTIGLLVVVGLLLYPVGCASRILQTLIAITGAHVMISLVLLPGLLLVAMAPVEGQPADVMVIIANTWRLAVYIHIFRQSLSINILLAAMLAIGYFLFSVWFAMYLMKLDF